MGAVWVKHEVVIRLWSEFPKVPLTVIVYLSHLNVWKYFLQIKYQKKVQCNHVHVCCKPYIWLIKLRQLKWVNVWKYFFANSKLGKYSKILSKRLIKLRIYAVSLIPVAFVHLHSYWLFPQVKYVAKRSVGSFCKNVFLVTKIILVKRQRALKIAFDFLNVIYHKNTWQFLS